MRLRQYERAERHQKALLLQEQSGRRKTRCSGCQFVTYLEYSGDALEWVCPSCGHEQITVALPVRPKDVATWAKAQCSETDLMAWLKVRAAHQSCKHPTGMCRKLRSGFYYCAGCGVSLNARLHGKRRLWGERVAETENYVQTKHEQLLADVARNDAFADQLRQMRDVEQVRRYVSPPVEKRAQERRQRVAKAFENFTRAQKHVTPRRDGGTP